MKSRNEFDAPDLFTDLPEIGRQCELLPAPAPVERDYCAQSENGVAEILLDLPLRHVDRPFDYAVPQRFSDLREGMKVLVPFGARKVEGYVVKRKNTTANPGALKAVVKLRSSVPVLDGDILRLCESVSFTSMAPVADCLRLAVPARHARAEQRILSLPAPVFPQYEQEKTEKSDLPPRCSRDLVHLLPGSDYFAENISLLKQTLSAGRGILILTPTAGQADKIRRRLSLLLPEEPVTEYTAELGREERFLRYLSILRGRTRIVVGTRSAAWAPVKNIGLIIHFDDLHTAYTEQHSPYCDARDVLYARSGLQKCRYIICNLGPSTAGAYFARKSGGQIIDAPPAKRRSGLPQILAANSYLYEGSPWARMPDSVFAFVREGLTRGCVLVAVPHCGYLPMIACRQCRVGAKCEKCGGRLEMPAPDAALRCVRCAEQVRHFRCGECGCTSFRAVRIGSNRTAQELGRAFRGIPVILGHECTQSEIVGERKLIVAAVGSIPHAADGYSCAIVLDTNFMLNSATACGEEMFLRTLAKITPFVRTRENGGKMLLVGDLPDNLVQVFGRWNFSEWEDCRLRELSQLGFPPVLKWYELSGSRAELKEFLALLRLRLGAGETGADIPFEALLTGGRSELIKGLGIFGPQRAENGRYTLNIKISSSNASVPKKIRDAVTEIHLRIARCGIRIRRIKHL